MRRLVLSLVLLAALGAPARAGEVEDRRARIVRLEAEKARLELTHQAQAALYQKKLEESDRAQKSKAFNARSKKADAQEIAKKLEIGQQKIKQVRDQILAERRQLVAALERAVAANPSDTRLQALLNAEKGRLPASVKKLKVADERIDPLDDPEDLDEKAARLKKSENELLKALEKELKRAENLRRQVKMIKVSQRAKDDPFHDGEKNRKGHGEQRTGATGGAPAGDRNDADSSGGGGGAGAAEQPPPAEGFTDDEAAPTSPEPQTPGASPVPLDVTVDVTTQYTEVLDQSTIDRLRTEAKSSDPEKRAQAAQKLADALKARADRVKKQREAIERRAKQLRGR